MTALSERNIEIVRTLVSAAPDKVVGSLQQALADTSDDSALGGVRRLVECEVADRNLRNTVLSPIAPMCVGAGDDKKVLTFPSRILGLLWRAMAEIEPDRMNEARVAASEHMPPGIMADLHDALVVAAAAGLRSRATADFATVADLCDAARADGARLLADCLDIAHIVRRAAQRLPEWLTHAGGETTAGARLAYKDAVEISEDVGQRLFQMLAAQMAEPWMVLRIVSAVMDKPPERYLADSELAWFGENLMADVDAALSALSSLDADAGPAAGRAAARTVEVVVQQILEMETSIELTREHGWGARVHKQRVNLAAVVERRLKDAEKAAVEALPTVASRLQGRRRPMPRLTEAPNPRLLNRAKTLLAFSYEVRTTANYGGFGSTRSRLVESLREHIDHYVEDVLDLVRTADAGDPEIAEAFLAAAGEFEDLLLGEKAGDLIRRRSHAALHPETATPPSR
ncbi:MAG: hypothetical protein JF588_11860 [Caulobacterales bacterium]|nr:hypothetical protein [Caulobacterales bacterium]